MTGLSISNIGGIYGADIRRDETAGPNTITFYKRRFGNPIYITCPGDCGLTDHLPDDRAEEIRTKGEIIVDCVHCGHEYSITPDDFEARYYTRFAAVDIGSNYE